MSRHHHFRIAFDPPRFLILTVRLRRRWNGRSAGGGVGGVWRRAVLCHPHSLSCQAKSYNIPSAQERLRRRRPRPPSLARWHGSEERSRGGAQSSLSRFPLARSLSPTRTIFDSLEGTRDGRTERGRRGGKAQGLGGRERGRGGPTYEKFMPTERNKQAGAGGSSKCSRE